MRSLAALIVSLLLCSGALGQSVQQSGSVTNKHIPYWVTSGVIADGGSSADSPISSMGVTNNGGAGFCVSSDRQSAAARNQLCFGASTFGPAVISLQNYGSATAQNLEFVINGTSVVLPTGGGQFIAGQPPFTANHVPCFVSSDGILQDCGLTLTTGGTVTAGVWQATPVGLSYGGTGATSASDARTNLGLGSMATQSASSVAITGGSITGMPSPVNPTDVAIKSYVDGLASGLIFLPQSRLATAAVLPNSPTYSNGSSGVGATLTAGSNSTLTVDGTVASLNDVVLVKNQSSAFQDGVYTVTTAGSGSAAWVLTRATYFDQSAEMLAGSYTFISAGVANSGTSWVLASNVATVGTDAVTFNQFSSSNTTNSVPSVADRTALASLNTATYNVAWLAESPRQGFFQYVTGNFSTQCTADTQQGVYVAASGDSSCTSGVWRRNIPSGAPTLDNFGAIGDCSTNNDTAIAGAISWAGAQTNGASLIIPLGCYVANSSISIGLSNFSMIGLGAGSIIRSAVTGPTFDIESPSSPTRITDLALSNFAMQCTSGACTAFKLISVQRIAITGISAGPSPSYPFATLMLLGTDANADDVIDVSFQGYFQSNGTDNAVKLVSGSQLKIYDSKFNGVGTSTEAVFNQSSSSSKNFDGIYVTNTVAENFPSFANIGGQGIANANFTNITTDRNKASSFVFAPASGGTIHQVAIVGGDYAGDTTVSTSRGILITIGSGAVGSISVTGSHFFSYGAACVSQVDAGLTDFAWTGGSCVDAGQQSAPGMRFYTGTGIVVMGTSIRDSSGAHMTYGIDWEGSSGNRIGGTSQNVITGYTNAAVNGTP